MGLAFMSVISLNKLRVLLSLFLVLILAGCAASLIRNPVPAALINQAHIRNLDDVRFWGDTVPKDLDRLLKARFKNFSALRSHYNRPTRQTLHYLALSGGGSDGAFGAGFLAGWSKTGTRPQFQMVTGISTGALIAPFAFLGPQYDDQLKEVFTQYSTADILISNPLKGLLGGISLTDYSPFEELIKKYVDEKMLRHVAQEYKKGRFLLIGTTNLDAQRPVIWDMGRIALSGHPQALDLFRKVLLASASIPGLFPPVHIDVVVGGKKYEEMHVDGGTTKEVFLAPTQLSFQRFDRFYKIKPRRKLYIIRNGRLEPEWQAVQASTFKIAGRSISTLIKNQSIGDLFQIYTVSQRDRIDFNLASIPKTFKAENNEAFDQSYMNALYKEGYQKAVRGYRWRKKPPGLTR